MPFSVTLVTLFPEMAKAITDFGVTRRAVENGQLQLDTVNPRDFTEDRHRTVDDRPFGRRKLRSWRKSPVWYYWQGVMRA